MSSHIETRNQILLTEKSTFIELLEKIMISENEKKMMKMYYIEKKSFSFIADDLGYSIPGIMKMHDRTLRKINKLL